MLGEWESESEKEEREEDEKWEQIVHKACGLPIEFCICEDQTEQPAK